MRNVAPIALDGVTPRDLSGEVGPDFDIVDPHELLVDDSYQRNPSARTIALVRRIVASWSWAKFKPPVVVRVDGRLHVLDGQHTAMAAASHPGISAIPVLVVAASEVSDRAAAFVSHAVDRVQAKPLQVHRAAVVAGDPAALAVEAVCREAGATLLSYAPAPGDFRARETVALATIKGLLARRGAQRARGVLAALAEADLAPIAGDHILAADALLCDEAYAGDFDAARVTAAFRNMTPAVLAEARELAAAKMLPAWRALTATLCRRAPKRARAKAPPAPAAQPARVAPAASIAAAPIEPAPPVSIVEPIAALIVEAEPPAPPPPRLGNWNTGVITSPKTPGARRADGPERVIMPSAAMARIVGVGPILRSDGVERLWRHIHGNGLLDPADRLVVIADDRLRAVYGRDRIAVADLESGLTEHFGARPGERPGERRAHRALPTAHPHPAGAAV